MKAFKELLKEDLNIFFNLDEFGEIHRIEGKECVCVLMADSSGNVSTVADKDLRNTGIHPADATLYLKKEDRPFKNSAGKILNVDGKEMQISKVSEESDVLIFNLHQFRRV